MSGRPCLVDELRLDQCREILELLSATNFDGSVVARLSILLSLYNCLQFKESLEESLRDVTSIWEDWKYLCDQPPDQFIELVYCFSQMMICRRELLLKFNKGATVLMNNPPSLEDIGLHGPELKFILNELVDNCVKLISVALRSSYISLLESEDMVKFMLYFAILILVNTLRQGFASQQWFSDDKLKEIKQSVKLGRELTQNMAKDLNKSNGFIESFRVLVAKFSESMSEQDL